MELVVVVFPPQVFRASLSDYLRARKLLVPPSSGAFFPDSFRPAPKSDAATMEREFRRTMIPPCTNGECRWGDGWSLQLAINGVCHSDRKSTRLNSSHLG